MLQQNFRPQNQFVGVDVDVVYGAVLLVGVAAVVAASGKGKQNLIKLSICYKAWYQKSNSLPLPCNSLLLRSLIEDKISPTLYIINFNKGPIFPFILNLAHQILIYINL